MRNKILYIIRGVSGSGKSTLAMKIADIVCEADEYFMQGGVYNFDHSKLAEAHASCKQRVERNMINGVKTIAVSNTNTTQKEIRPYLHLAEQYGYTPIVLVVENYHGNSDVHNVPSEVKQKQERNLRNSLKLS